MSEGYRKTVRSQRGEGGKRGRCDLKEWEEKWNVKAA